MLTAAEQRLQSLRSVATLAPPPPPPQQQTSKPQPSAHVSVRHLAFGYHSDGLSYSLGRRFRNAAELRRQQRESPEHDLEEYLLTRLRQSQQPQSYHHSSDVRSSPALSRDVVEPPHQLDARGVDNSLAASQKSIHISEGGVSPKRHDGNHVSSSMIDIRSMRTPQTTKASGQSSARSHHRHYSPQQEQQEQRLPMSNALHRFRNRSPRDLLSPPDPSLVSEYTVYQQSHHSPIGSLRRYQQVTDPMRDLSAASVGIPVRRLVVQREHYVDGSREGGHDSPSYTFGEHHQSLNSHSVRGGRGNSPGGSWLHTPPTGGVPQRSPPPGGSPQYHHHHHERTARKEQEAMALRYEFDDMIRREAERNSRLQQEVEALRAAREYDSLAKERESDHQRRMLAIIAAEESAKAHSQAQRRLIELSVKGRELANEIERRAASPIRNPKHSSPSHHHSEIATDRLTERQRLELHLYSVQKQKVLHTSRSLGLAAASRDRVLLEEGEDPHGQYPLVHHNHQQGVTPSRLSGVSERAAASAHGGGIYSPYQHNRVPASSGSGAFLIPQHFTPVKSSPRPFMQQNY
ncbi:Hypothetical protein, putative [Bodo saltans]|uniref:Uncharacterized protein n=1 Tax=Bodo saltans TaxID=75058 RepID=A0A0S4J8K5_BODSA|nr:Hypothetical protein, putative [Bodo saltans]|eukprot:CUG84230.1 Hypothetical protein, putative [Bodo saltans]